MIEREAAARGTLEAEDAVAPEDEDAGRIQAESLVEMVLSEHAERQERSTGSPSPRLSGIVIGVLAGIGSGREPLVDFCSNPRGQPLPGRSTVTVGEGEVGRDVALMFEEGDPTKPILIGLIDHPEPLPAVEAAEGDGASKVVEVLADGEKVIVSAERELVLRCGDASITLTRAGKILIRGAYVLTRSSGVNRIQGGSVQIN